MIVYKKCKLRDKKTRYWTGDYCIVTLEVSPRTRVVMSNNYQWDTRSNKCRASRAKVLKIETLNGKPIADNLMACSFYNSLFKYVVGRTVVAKDFNPSLHEICAKGIHFFRTHNEAVMYDY